MRQGLALPREAPEPRGSEAEPSKSSYFVLQRRIQAQQPGQPGTTLPKGSVNYTWVPAQVKGAGVHGTGGTYFRSDLLGQHEEKAARLEAIRQGSPRRLEGLSRSCLVKRCTGEFGEGAVYPLRYLHHT